MPAKRQIDSDSDFVKKPAAKRRSIGAAKAKEKNYLDSDSEEEKEEEDEEDEVEVKPKPKKATPAKGKPKKEPSVCSTPPHLLTISQWR
jgi:hypothetical protein